ncbi:MAG: hypothetical protein OMM_12931, partial [Candidatus Magnetoglobus multicellularis str. Araruama]
VIEDWGDFPGEGMHVDSDKGKQLIITGIQLGNIQIMVQPKRGCYGAKCNGEVCRILHDPTLSPPHHWLATYHYIQQTSDAVIHFGAEGSLEYLPGKRSALSNECFPEISLGDLPNFYIYVMDIPGEGLMAKRRGRAVIVDHLTPVYLPVSLDDDMVQLNDYLIQYQKAEQMQVTSRMSNLHQKMIPLIKNFHLGDTPLELSEFNVFIQTLSRTIRQMQHSLSPIGLHVLGKQPDDMAKSQMLYTLLKNLQNKPNESSTIPSLENLENQLQDKALSIENCCNQLKTILFEASDDSQNHLDLQRFCLPLAEKLNDSQNEIKALISCLNGEYLPPGLGGSFYQGKLDTLPSGRNFYPTDIGALPTASAWEMGKILADKILMTYHQEEGQFPENIGISIWSSDAFKSDGEVFSQVLYLLGVKPAWRKNGRIKGIEIIPLDELTIDMGNKELVKRPRVDVTIQTSGILRDMVPNFCDYMDEAVVMVSKLSEPMEYNYVLKHTQQKIEE